MTTRSREDDGRHYYLLFLILVSFQCTLVSSSRHRRHNNSNTYFQNVTGLISADDDDKYHHRTGAARSSTRIVGGHEAREGEYNFFVALYFGTMNGNKPVCGGTLITPSVFVTAAHCAYSLTSAEIGRRDVNDNNGDSDVERYKIRWSQKHIHPDYNPNTYDNDIALIELPQRHAGAVTASIPRRDSSSVPLTTLTAIGFGRVSTGGEQPDVLLEVNVQHVSDVTCRKIYSQDFNYQTMLCARDDGKDTCQGDSGGPLLDTTTADSVTLMGITSWGRDCASQYYPGVYVKVSAYEEWMDQVVCQDISPGDCLDGRIADSFGEPTSEPSQTPTASPSYSVEPTHVPSFQPTTTPSTNPTTTPSLTPSTAPTTKPSALPSFVPTAFPSISPTVSALPSASPTMMASNSPSVTSHPSLFPTEVHSSVPSAAPSSSPSGVPSPLPSHSPSARPSAAPSQSPSSIPTKSFRPTRPLPTTATTTVQFELPHTNTVNCFDVDSFTLVGTLIKTCDWVAQRKGRRCSVYGNEYCPKSCNLC